MKDILYEMQPQYMNPHRFPSELTFSPEVGVVLTQRGKVQIDLSKSKGPLLEKSLVA